MKKKRTGRIQDEYGVIVIRKWCVCVLRMKSSGDVLRFMDWQTEVSKRNFISSSRLRTNNNWYIYYYGCKQFEWSTFRNVNQNQILKTKSHNHNRNPVSWNWMEPISLCLHYVRLVATVVYMFLTFVIDVISIVVCSCERRQTGVLKPNDVNLFILENVTDNKTAQTLYLHFDQISLSPHCQNTIERVRLPLFKVPPTIPFIVRFSHLHNFCHYCPNRKRWLSSHAK